MREWKYHLSPHDFANNAKAIQRDGVLAIGCHGYAEIGIKPLTARTWFESYRRKTTMTDKKTLVQDTPSKNETTTAKRPATSSPSGESKTKKSKPATQADDDGDDDTASSTDPRIPSRPSTPSTKNSEPKPEQAKQPVIELHDDDSDVVEIVKTPNLKRKASVSTKPETAKKRSKQAESSDVEDEEPVKSAKSSAVKRAGATGKASATKKTVRTETEDQEDDDDKDEGDEASEVEEEESDDDESEEEVDPEAVQKLAKANKDLGKACKKCKVDANKALKTKHTQEIQKLKKSHKQELREAKGKADKTLKAEKSKAEKKEQKLRTKHEAECDALKESRREKIKEGKEKIADTIDEWQDKYDEMKANLEGKNKDLAQQRDESDIKRKHIEKATAAQIKDMTADQKAGELRLKEERRTMKNDNHQMIQQLKPEHSRVVKELTKSATSWEQKASNLELQLRDTTHELNYSKQVAHDNEQAYRITKEKLEKSHAANIDAEDNCREIEAWCNDVEQRAEARVAADLEKAERHAQAKILIERKLVQEQTNRVVEQQRVNRNLKESLQIQSQLSREKGQRIRELEAELEKTKAEMGVAAEMERVDVPQFSEAVRTNGTVV